MSAPRNDARWVTGPPEEVDRYRVTDVNPGSSVFSASCTSDTVAWDGDTVSLKHLGPVPSNDEAEIRGLFRHIYAIGRPNLVQPLELFRGPPLHRHERPPPEEWDALYAVSRWVDGRTLWAALHHDEDIDTARLVRDVGSGLAALHGRGLVHGDIHPGNVILGDDGEAVVIDLDTVAPAGAPRRPGSTGVLGFIPPELGEDAPTARRSSDGWQLAMLVVQCLLGHPLGRGEDLSTFSGELRALLGRRRAARTESLLTAMLHPEPGARPPDVAGWAVDVASVLEAPRPSAARRTLVAGLLVLGLVGVGAGMLDVRDDETTGAEEATAAEPSAATADAAHASGPDSPCSLDRAPSPAHEELIEANRDEVADALAASCPASVDSFVNAAVLDIDGTGAAGVVVITPANHVVTLSDTQWASYRELGGRQRPENAADLAGYPVARSVDGSTVTIELSHNGIMVAPSPRDVPYWIPSQILPDWRAAGGAEGEFGFPASHPFFYESRIVQDFEHVELSTTSEAMYQTAEEVDPTVTQPDDPTAPLADVGPVEGRILRQRSGIAWYVDTDGVRHWIPDGTTFFCLGGEDALVPLDLPGYAIWTLPKGDPATCGS